MFSDVLEAPVALPGEADKIAPVLANWGTIGWNSTVRLANGECPH
jgi:hypothetical protein